MFYYLPYVFLVKKCWKKMVMNNRIITSVEIDHTFQVYKYSWQWAMTLNLLNY